MRKLEDIIDKLSLKEQDELELITERIKNAGSVDMIILYGSYARGEQVRNFDRKMSDYDILVITSVCNEKSIKRIKYLLGALFQDIERNVSCEVESFEKVTKRFKENYYFYADVRRDGVVLYKKGNAELPEPENLTIAKQLEISKKYLTMWFEALQMNFDASGMFKKRALEKKQPSFNKKAVFELQQCVENCHKTIELVHERYAPKEHRLGNLRNRIKKIAPEIYSFFPIRNEEQKKDYKYLDEAYIRARYDDAYLVTESQLDYWMEEAKRLMNYTDQICKEHIEHLEQEIK